MPFRSAFGAYADVNGTDTELSDFTPISALWDNASDVILLFLCGNGVMFREACHDPWYSATTQVNLSMTSDSSSDTNFSAYLHDESAGLFGCTSRVQFCNADSKSGKSCTSLAGFHKALAAVDALWSTDEQKGFFDAWLNNVWIEVSDISIVIFIAGIAFLKTRDTLANGFQSLLFNNQWQLEVENWYDAILIDLQRLTVQYATDSIDSVLLQIMVQSQTGGEHQLCHSVVSISAFLLFSFERRL